ncbi:YciI family protein [Pseudoxanthomonas sp. J35]|uniref:YciI family protein n=1 Tax=Pseudoxanthomonas sp. J35 TaxID=935852 RepID=UPI0004B270EF|nr:YciI family protein [Pseudoxanthomonas sp. J35]
MTPEAVARLVSQCPALDEKMQATGKMRVSASLAEPKDWKTLRTRAGRMQASDGPYTEAKEMVGGLFIIEAIHKPGFVPCFVPRAL